MDKSHQGNDAMDKGVGGMNGEAGSCRVGPESDSEVELLDAYSRAVITVAESVGPAVVGVFAGKGMRGGAAEPAGAGSGVIIAPDGYILTNDHVVQAATNLTVILQDGICLEATRVGTDPAHRPGGAACRRGRFALRRHGGIEAIAGRAAGDRHRQPFRVCLHRLHRGGECPR